MSREEIRTPGTYYTIIDGTFRTQVPADSEGAIRRDWVSKDGTKSGTKYERHVNALIGKITNVQFFDGDFGQQLVISLDADEAGRVPRIALQVASREAEDVMKKLPAVDMTKEVRFRPFAFKDDKDREVRGIEMAHAGADGKWTEKITNFFKDPETSENRNGFPAPKDEDTSGYTADQWKLYFLECRIFLVNYTKEKVAPKIAPAPVSAAQAAVDEAYGEDLAVGDIPFN